MKELILSISLLTTSLLRAVPMSWADFAVCTIGHDGDFSWHDCYGTIYQDGMAVAELSQILWGHCENGNYYLKMFDYGNPMITASVNNSWVLTYYAQVLSADSFEDMTKIALGDYGSETSGGTFLENPSDFYLGFKTWNSENTQSWYGWLHLSYDVNEKLSVLDNGIGCQEESLIVGSSASPEPSTGVLLLLGVSLLGLRRKIKGKMDGCQLRTPQLFQQSRASYDSVAGRLSITLPAGRSSAIRETTGAACLCGCGVGHRPESRHESRRESEPMSCGGRVRC